jgi:hypothetical protein
MPQNSFWVSILYAKPHEVYRAVWSCHPGTKPCPFDFTDKVRRSPWRSVALPPAELTSTRRSLRFLLFGSLHLRVVPVFLVVDLTLFFYEFNELGFALARVQKLDADPETWFLDKKTAIHHVADDRYTLVFKRGNLNRHTNLDRVSRLYTASAKADTGEVPHEKQVGIFRAQQDRDEASEPRVTTVVSFTIWRRHG